MAPYRRPEREHAPCHHTPMPPPTVTTHTRNLDLCEQSYPFESKKPLAKSWPSVILTGLTGGSDPNMTLLDTELVMTSSQDVEGEPSAYKTHCSSHNSHAGLTLTVTLNPAAKPF